ncbi:hypothetical protein M2S00_06610 [Apilactobacillus sp. TMW 2.2459]|uniref:hypothetical protein n=1 Tax=Apilactobacillus xinyiensis TaxID=2841032 RepID=UPI00200C8E19|nr:hypothetical protein [Apilactobacillus xinyiensis]MCL0312775.1 hypothetical protein [Apilactobacillus xinyiensis]
MRKIVKNIKKYSGHFYVAVSAMMIGLYIMFHLNYLDDPRVTPPPPITGAEHAATGFADDWWFGVILIIAALIMFIGINIDNPKLRSIAISVITGCYGAITVAFFIRGVYDYRFNLTWIFSLLALAFIRQVLSTRGGGHHFK